MAGEGWTGRWLTRREDERLLTGRGRFTDDLRVDGAAHAAFVRSPHPHAALRGVDAGAARSMPGVLAVLAAPDLAGDVSTSIPSLSRTPPFAVRNVDGSEPPDPSQPLLAVDRVRYAGEAVAMVVAETAAQARAAAEAVVVDYRPLTPLSTVEAAQAEHAPRIWEDAAGNRSVTWQCGDAEATEAAFAGAAHAVRRALLLDRLAVAFMEPRASIGEYDAAEGRYTLTTGCQSAHRMQATLAGVLGVEPERIRVRVPDMGGGFGARGALYPEMALVLVAARRLDRPVRWVASRSESFLTDGQARDELMHGELALDGDGRVTAIRVRIDWRHGGYLTGRSIWVLTHFMPPTLGGVYAIPRGHLLLRGVFTNTTPQTAYRGVGRVECSYLVESLMDAAARELGLDRVELRRRNVVRGAQLPWRSPGGAVYRSGEFSANLERALALADWAGFAARRRAARARGLLRGIGLALYVENDGGAPADFGEVEVLPAGGEGGTGEVVARSGTQSFGMAHETVFAQVLADELDIAPGRIRLLQGDTDAIADGYGSHGSRSMRIGGGALVEGARLMLARARELAARLLEAAPAELDYAEGRFSVRGRNRSADLFEIAAHAAAAGERLRGAHTFVMTDEAHSNGCQVCELEVDPETGVTRVVRHLVVADVGRAINPMVVHGQLHGGVAQGLGQAVMERVVYDRVSGQTLSGSFMDYALPRADDLPAFDIELNEVVETDNPLGVKGAGELGTSGAPAAYMNALRDALGESADGLQMPATPERVWRALRGATPP